MIIVCIDYLCTTDYAIEIKLLFMFLITEFVLFLSLKLHNFYVAAHFWFDLLILRFKEQFFMIVVRR